MINANHSINKKKVLKSNIDDILKIFRSQGRNYYLDTVTKVVTDYVKIFNKLKISHNIFFR
jgi:hypothetical protein